MIVAVLVLSHKCAETGIRSIFLKGDSFIEGLFIITFLFIGHLSMNWFYLYAF